MITTVGVRGLMPWCKRTALQPAGESSRLRQQPPVTAPARSSGVSSAMGGCRLRRSAVSFPRFPCPVSLPPSLLPPRFQTVPQGLAPTQTDIFIPSHHCHTIPCSEPGHKALIKTHDFKLSKLSKSRKDGERERENVCTVFTKN